MMENNRCRRWLTTNQDEYQNPVSKKIDGYVTSEEFGRYEDCMIRKACQEQREKEIAREAICCGDQNENREPVFFSSDSHIDPELKATKATWCRCLATGDPNLYEENREEAKTDDMCYCRMCYNQTDVPAYSNPRAKIYSSTNFIDFRDPNFPFIENKTAIRKALDDKFKAYKAKVDAVDAMKEPKLAPASVCEDETNRVEANCIGNYPCLPPGKSGKPWKEDQSWFREETSDCVKNLLKKYTWTTTYREMNKDGAALPLVVRETPTSCIERPPGDQVRSKKSEVPRCTIVNPGLVLEKWDRPQVRTMAQRCDTITNNPNLDKCCLDKDPYFQEQFLNRGKYAQCTNAFNPPSEENMRLARENKLRQPYDRMLPYFGGYIPMEAPPVCKIKKIFNPFDPYETMTMYQADFIHHPKDMYEHPVEPYRPDDLDKKGISTNPINTAVRKPLPDAVRLSCYLECKKVPCQGPDSMSEYLDCQKMPCTPPPRNFGQPMTNEDPNPDQKVQVVIPAVLRADGDSSSFDIDIPKEYRDCPRKTKEDLMVIGTYVATPEQINQKSGNLTLAKKKEFTGCS